MTKNQQLTANSPVPAILLRSFREVKEGGNGGVLGGVDASRQNEIKWVGWRSWSENNE